MDQIAKWATLARGILQTGMDIFRTANVSVTEKGCRDERVLAMTLLARTVSNFKSAMLLIDNRRIIESRVIVRCCLENSYWVAGLAAEGEKFSREMLHDEMSHRQRRGQRMFKPGFNIDDTIKAKLAAWMSESGKRFKDAKSLNPMGVALKTDLGRSYIFYEQLSSDAAHPSLDALNRHIIPHTQDETGGIDVDPLPTDAEIVETLEYLCMAAIGVLVGVNQIIGGTDGGKALNGLADRYKVLSDESAAQHTTLRAHVRAASS
jgi:Family of unknown function (DUF5677)